MVQPIPLLGSDDDTEFHRRKKGLLSAHKYLYSQVFNDVSYTILSLGIKHLEFQRNYAITHLKGSGEGKHEKIILCNSINNLYLDVECTEYLVAAHF